MALQVAVSKSNESMASKLLEAGANPSAKDKVGVGCILLSMCLSIIGIVAFVIFIHGTRTL